jgi:hypothetical protein
MDQFGTYAKTPRGPYDRAVVITPALGEFEPTTALHVNCEGMLTCVFADDVEPVTITFDAIGLYPYRIKQVISFTLGGSTDQFVSDSAAPAIVGLY